MDYPHKQISLQKKTIPVILLDMLKFIISLFFIIAVGYSAYQIYKVYDAKTTIGADLNQIVDEYRSGKIYTEEEIKARISSILERHNTQFDPKSFILKQDDKKPDLSFSVDYKKAPDLSVVEFPISFHLEIPDTGDSGPLGNIIKSARGKAQAAQKASNEKIEKASSASESK
jgi:hypothetical protein